LLRSHEISATPPNSANETIRVGADPTLQSYHRRSLLASAVFRRDFDHAAVFAEARALRIQESLAIRRMEEQ